MLDLFGKWKEKATQYFDVRVQLVKLTFIARASNVLSTFILALIFIMAAMLVFLFIGLGVMECFTQWLDSRIGGAFATAGFFLVFLLIMYIARKGIGNNFAGIFVRIMTEGDDEEDDDDDKQEIRKKKKVTPEEEF